MGYELKRNDVFDFAISINSDTHEKGDELFFKRCPYCNGGGSDKDTFSINLNSGFFKCFRATCGKQGHFVQLARDFNFPLETEENPRKKKYKDLPQRPIVIKNAAVEYLKSRGIGEEVTRKYKITTVKNDDNILVFPFYDQNNILKFIKYRKTNFDRTVDKNKEWCEQDTMPIMFGMAQCDGFDQIVVTEGQLDSLSLAEAGIKNPVSVPTGAMGFTWLDSNCYEWISQFNDVVVFGDHEHGKVTLSEELTKRLPQKVRVVRPEDYLLEKDANDILRKYGTDAITYAVNNACQLPVKNIKLLRDVQSIDISKLEKFKTNIRELDGLIGGFYFGQLAIITGKRGEGKSTLVGQLVLEALEQGYSSLVYSGELPDYHFKNWLDRQAAGSKYLENESNEYGSTDYYVPENVVDAINEWYGENIYLYDNSFLPDENENDGLCQIIENSIKRYGVRLIFVDNLMTAMDVEMGDDIYRAQAQFVKNLKWIAIKYNVVVILVAHPKKTNAAFDNDTVSGSAEITNRADLVINYSKSTKPDADHDGEIMVTKNRMTGEVTKPEEPLKMVYSKSSKRISSAVSGSSNREYGWVKYLRYDDISKYDLPFD